MPKFLFMEQIMSNYTFLLDQHPMIAQGEADSTLKIFVFSNHYEFLQIKYTKGDTVQTLCFFIL